MNQIFGQMFNILEQFRYSGRLLFQLQAVQLATSFQLNNEHTKIVVNLKI